MNSGAAVFGQVRAVRLHRRGELGSSGLARHGWAVVEPGPLWGGHPRDPGVALGAGLLVRGAFAWNTRRVRERLPAPPALRCAPVPADQQAVSE